MENKAKIFTYSENEISRLSDDDSGVYLIMSSEKKVLYIGSSVRLKDRLFDHLREGRINGNYVKVILVDLVDIAEDEEIRLIKKYDPPYNKQHTD